MRCCGLCFRTRFCRRQRMLAGPPRLLTSRNQEVVYERILGHVTPVLPRLSATLVEPAAAKVMAQHEVQLPQLWEEKTADALAQRLGARAMPIEAKRKLAAVGNSLDAELDALHGIHDRDERGSWPGC